MDGKRSLALERGQRLSAIDNIHKVAGRITEKEAAKAPVFCRWPVHHFCSRRADSGCDGIKILYAD